MLDFPNAPTTNQIFTGPRGTYRWDGVKWAPYAAGADAPVDGALYGRLNATWGKAVPLAGGVMTGLLSLSADPVSSLEAATKQYADTKLAKAGGTMTGTLTLIGNPAGTLDAAPKQYVDQVASTNYATPTASLGLAAIPGSATTAMRSDAAPALSVAIAPTWTAWHSFNAGMRSSGSSPPASGAGLELLWNGTSAVIQAYDRGAAAFKALLLQGTSLSTNCGGSLGGSYTVSGNVDATGQYRAQGYAPPASGVGLEIVYTGGTGVILAYDRTAAAFKPLQFQASSYTFTNAGASFAGPVAASQFNNQANTVAAVMPTVTINTSYNQLYDSSSRSSILLGGTADQSNYYRNAAHNFQSVGGSANFMSMAASGVNIPISTGSTSTTTGALTIAGGIGCGQQLFVGNQCDVNGTIRATSQTVPPSGAGLEILYSGGQGYIQTFDRGAGQYKPLNISASGTTFTNAGNVAIQATNAASSTTSGALVVTGGAGIGGDLFAKTINGRNAGNWAGTFVNSTIAVNQAGMYVACGALSATADTQSIFTLYTDPNISAYIGYVIRNGANSLSFANASDARLKTTVREASDRGLDALRAIAVRDFYWNNDQEKTVVQGLYAQELADIYPEVVTHPEMIDKDGKPTGEIAWGIDYGRLTPLLIRAIQQLAERVERLENA